MSLRDGAALVLGCALLAACTTSHSCAQAQCPDLLWFERDYIEWRTVDAAWADEMMHPVVQLQEVGDATYPACNVSDSCGGDEFDGLAATETWALVGIEPTQALLALDQDSQKLAIYVAQGIDPESLAPKMDQGMFGG